MKKKGVLVFVSILFLCLTGCGKSNSNENNVLKEEKKINGNCSAIQCIEKLDTKNTVEEINKIIGFDGILTDEKYNKYTWTY